MFLQAAMLLVVIWGLAATVPVVRFELLQRDNDKLEEEIRAKEDRLAEIEPQFRSAQIRIDSLNATIAALEDREDSLTRRTEEAREALTDATWRLFVLDVRSRPLRSWIMPVWLRDRNRRNLREFPYELEELPEPFSDLIDVIERVRRNPKYLPEYPASFYEKAIAHIESRKHVLVCTFDFYGIRERFFVEISDIPEEGYDPRLYDIVPKYMEETRSALNECIEPQSTVLRELEAVRP